MLVIQALDQLHVPYLIGGSLASALYGVARATMDSDLVADLRLEHAQPLAEALSSVFYADVEAMRDAILHQNSFNVIHLETMFKVDIFVCKKRSFDRIQFKRRIEQVVATEPDRKAYVSTAEDIILAKLEWYRMGGEISERQLRNDGPDRQSLLSKNFSPIPYPLICAHPRKFAVKIPASPSSSL